MTLGVLSAGTVVGLAVLAVVLVDVTWPYVTVLAVGLVLPAMALLRFRSDPTPAAAKKQEGMSSLAMLLGYCVLLAALVARNGLQWG